MPNPTHRAERDEPRTADQDGGHVPALSPRGIARALRLPGIADAGRALRRVPVAVWDDDVTDWAAALTYYAILALFPTLLVTLSLVGIAGPSATDDLIRSVSGMVPETSRPLMEDALHSMAGQRTTAWALAVLGALWALWSSSSYLAVFRRAMHSMYGVKDRRPVIRKVPHIVLTALSLLVLLVGSVAVLMLSGELARSLGGLAGMDALAAALWRIGRWPLLLSLVVLLILVLFRTGPAGDGMRGAAPGGALAAVLWLATCGGFAFYSAHVSTYHRLYGSLAGIVVFLVWLWLSNLALLCGAQFNAELHKLRRAERAMARRYEMRAA